MNILQVVYKFSCIESGSDVITRAFGVTSYAKICSHNSKIKILFSLVYTMAKLITFHVCLKNHKI